MSKLLSPVQLAKLDLKNRVVMPPCVCTVLRRKMGWSQPFHEAHYGARAIGQVGLIILEATVVESDGRLSNQDLGIWSDQQLPGLTKLARQLHDLGSKVGHLTGAWRSQGA
ncbi:hypothetical protein [Streptococcus sp. HF-1907]|uniref:oxidoreductase n=1 Tax=Streptococcus sp. HF-1907 TaxID=2785793 RepID=UPI00226C9478|nr:hypothetical protein [Streptococcus sp. HF-1907]